MTKQMIINANASEEIRVAIIEGDRLLDLDIDVADKSKQKGNIYKGIVANVEDSLEAAFIEFGDDKQAFLALSEVRPALYPAELKGQRRPKISDVLKRGQELVVQVTKDEIGNKGAAVTTYLSLPGRYTVLMHSDDSGGGVSRKIDDEQARRRARDVLRHIDVPDGMAVIIRTAGMNRPMVDLYRDLRSLAKVWETIDRGAQLGRAPTLLYREPDLVVRTIRDYLAADIGKVVIDAEDEYEELKSYFEERSPDALSLLDRYEGRQPIFEKFGIERAIEGLFERQVKLPSGGYIVIDQTEALVAIDVNSGRSTKEHDHEATVYKTNLEAAREIARQLRLRDMGGIIVVDFIDMVNRRHDRDVERALKDAMRDDKARVKIGRISENGTLEITRQRLRQAHRLVSQTPCPHCAGTGMVREPRGLATAAMRELTNKLAKTAQHLARLTVRLPVDVANILNTQKRRELLDLSEEHQCLVDVQADARLMGDEIKYDEERRGRAGLDAAHAVRDPRLTEGGGRRRRSRRDEGAGAYAGQTLGPPPSIGPVPQFLETEEAIIEADRRAAEEEEQRAQEAAAAREAEGEAEGEGAPSERGRRDRPERHDRSERFDRGERGERPQAVPSQPEHFDDPLTEALFGSAPDVALADAEAKGVDAPAALEGEAGEGGVRKKRRRRRRRGGARPEGAAAQAGEAGDGAEGGADDGPDGTTEGDEGDDEAAPSDDSSVSAERTPAARPDAAHASADDTAEGDAVDDSDEEGEADSEGAATEAGATDAEKAEGARKRRRRRGRRGGRNRRRDGAEGPGPDPVPQAAEPAAGSSEGA